MDWTLWAVAAGVIIAFLLFKKLRLISTSKARELLKQGALVVDVRTESEFSGEHAPGAINIPLDRLSRQIASHAPDKHTPLLLHCLGGGRSELARLQLRKAGYTNVHNLGSLGRALRIVTGEHQG